MQRIARLAIFSGRYHGKSPAQSPTLAVDLSPGENRATPPFKPAVSPPESQAGSHGSLPPKRPPGRPMGSKA